MCLWHVGTQEPFLIPGITAAHPQNWQLVRDRERKTGPRFFKTGTLRRRRSHYRRREPFHRRVGWS